MAMRELEHPYLILHSQRSVAIAHLALCWVQFLDCFSVVFLSPGLSRPVDSTYSILLKLTMKQELRKILKCSSFYLCKKSETLH